MARLPFLKGLGWLLVLNVLIKPIWIFGIDLQVQNAVGTEAYGKYFALLALTYVLLFLADAGLTNLTAQRLAAGLGISVRQLIRLKFGLLTLYLTVCLLIGYATGVEQWDVLMYLAVMQALGSLFLFLRSLLASAQLFQTDAWFSVLDKALIVVLCAGPVYGLFGSITIELFLQLQVSSAAVAVLILIATLGRRRLIDNSQPSQPLRKMLQGVLPFAGIVLLMAAHYRLDGFLLERLRPNGAQEAGVYAAAYRLLDAGNMVGYLCASFLMPFVARNTSNQSAVQSVVLIVRHGLMLIGLLALAFVIVYGDWLQQTLYNTNRLYNIQVLQLCLAVLPAYYLIHIYGSVLTATDNRWLFIRILVISVLLNVVLNIWLIPGWGAMGCAVAAIASQWFCAVIVSVAASKKLRLPVDALSLFGYILIGGLCAGLFYWMRTTANPVWVILVAVAALAVGGMMYRNRLATKFRHLFNS